LFPPPRARAPCDAADCICCGPASAGRGSPAKQTYLGRERGRCPRETSCGPRAPFGCQPDLLRSARPCSGFRKP
jgi:hypothetical protein